MKKVLITGITGQDGSYLAEFLLDKGYQVHGLIRRSSVFTTSRIDHLLDKKNFVLHHGDMHDSSNIISIIKTVNPSEIYHLAAQSHVAVSFAVPEDTGNTIGLGLLRLLNAVHLLNPEIKIYNASTSEMFGGFKETSPQSETTAFHPRSPYGAAKLYSHWLGINYREAYGMFVANGILFNHESPRRGETFVTRKITRGVARYKKTNQGLINLGNLYSVRDWGYAANYVEAMYLMLQQELPDDFVIATSIGTSVKEFVNKSFKAADIELTWDGEGINEIAVDSKNGKKVVGIDQKHLRASEVDFLLGDYSKAERILGWEPTLGIDELIEVMVESDMRTFSAK
jgi:GDPmannose 4,6-dehydratase